MDSVVLRRLRLASIVVAAAGLAIAPPAPVTPVHAAHRHAGKRHRRHCREGRVRLRMHHHRTRCVRHTQAPRLIAPALAGVVRDSLAHLPTARARGHRYRAPLSRRMRRSVRLAAARVPQAVRIAARGQSLEGELRQTGADFDLQFDDTGGSLTVRLGKEVLEAGLHADPEPAPCPDADGISEATGSVTVTLHMQSRLDDVKKWPFSGPRGALAFMFFETHAEVRARGHVGDDARLVDYEARGSTRDHLQIGVKNAAGKVLRTNAPALITSHDSVAHLKPPPRPKSPGFRRWARNALARGSYSVVVSGDWQQNPIGLAQGHFIAAAALAGLKYPEAQDEHWLHAGDCVTVGLQASRTTLEPGERTTITATPTPARGPKVAPTALTATAQGGAVAPPAAAAGGPATFTFTAPAAGWNGGSVTVRAVSRQGTGTATIPIAAARRSYVLRVRLDQSRRFSGDDGTGSATWIGSADVPLHQAAGGAWSGSARFAWSTFSYADHGIPVVCQAGGYGHEDADAAGSTPGSLTVAGATIGAGVTLPLRFAAPSDSVRRTFHHDATTCGDFTRTSSYDGYYDRGVFTTAPGVTTKYGADPAATVYTIGGWRPGSGAVIASRDMTRTANATTTHARLELIAVP